MSIAALKSTGRLGSPASLPAASSAGSAQRPLTESLVLILMYYRGRLFGAAGVLCAGVLLGVVSQEMASKYGDLGLTLLAVIAVAGFVSLGVAVALPALPLLGCVAVSFSSSSALLHAHYGLPVLAKYLPLLLLFIVTLHWIRQRRSELIPTRLWLESREAGTTPAAFLLCLSLLLVIYLFTLMSVPYALEQTLAAEALAGQRRDLLLSLALALSIGQFGRWSTLPVVCTIALYSTTAVILVAIAASFYPQLGGVLPGFASVYDGGQPGEAAIRIAGAFSHPNSLGRYAVFMMPVAVCLIGLGRGFERALAVSCLLILLAGVMLSESRGALLVLGLIALPALFVAIRTVKARYWLPALVVGAIVIGAAWQHVDTERMMRSVRDVERFVEYGDAPTDGATRGRLSEMRVAYEQWKTHPYLGVGLANYEHHFQTYSYDLGTKLYNDDRAAHSMYLELLAERGIIGLIGFVLAIAGILITVLYHGVSRLHSGAGVQGRLMLAMVVSALAYYLSAMLLHDVHSSPVWALIGVMIASLRSSCKTDGNERRAVARTWRRT